MAASISFLRDCSFRGWRGKPPPKNLLLWLIFLVHFSVWASGRLPKMIINCPSFFPLLDRTGPSFAGILFHFFSEEGKKPRPTNPAFLSNNRAIIRGKMKLGRSQVKSMRGDPHQVIVQKSGRIMLNGFTSPPKKNTNVGRGTLFGEKMWMGSFLG